MKTVMNWFNEHSFVRHLLVLFMVMAFAWFLGQFVGPAVMKTIFL